MSKHNMPSQILLQFSSMVTVWAAELWFLAALEALVSQKRPLTEVTFRTHGALEPPFCEQLMQDWFELS